MASTLHSAVFQLLREALSLRRSGNWTVMPLLSSGKDTCADGARL